MQSKFPPRLRGYYDGDDYLFCPEQWEQEPFKDENTEYEFTFISLQEHTAIVKELREALEFYADPYNWVSNSGKVGVGGVWEDYGECNHPRKNVNGERARQALEKLGNNNNK